MEPEYTAEDLIHAYGKGPGNLGELAAALVKAQAAMKGAVKDSRNPHFGSSYADLASVWDACREPLTANGLCVIQMPGRGADGLVTITTLLLHVSGQRIESTVGVRPSKDDAQGLGSVLTYLRRYALAAMVGIAPEDDDGEAAVGRGGDGSRAEAARDRGRRPAPRVATPEPPSPAPVAGCITEKQHGFLEAQISSFARTWNMDKDALRQRVKDKIGTIGVEHFTELRPDQFEAVLRWLGQQETEGMTIIDRPTLKTLIHTLQQKGTTQDVTVLLLIANVLFDIREELTALRLGRQQGPKA